jgi:hypothetical protein
VYRDDTNLSRAIDNRHVPFGLNRRSAAVRELRERGRGELGAQGFRRGAEGVVDVAPALDVARAAAQHAAAKPASVLDGIDDLEQPPERPAWPWIRPARRRSVSTWAAKRTGMSHSAAIRAALSTSPSAARPRASIVRTA